MNKFAWCSLQKTPETTEWYFEEKQKVAVTHTSQCYTVFTICSLNMT